MGGRGSGGSRGGGGSAKKVPTGEGITDKNELINLYNSISGNSNLSVEQRVKAMHDIQERIKELDAKKVSDLKYNLRRGVESDGYISNSDFRVEDYGNSVSVQIRYLGKWKNPSHARYEEDYDWQELRSSSGKQIDKVIKKMSKQSGRKITWSASEKNWIDIDIPKMKGE